MRPDTATASAVHQPSERFLVIVTQKPGLYEYARRLLASYAHITVVLDRRQRERREGPSPAGYERRRAERRLRPQTDVQLRLQDWAVVRTTGRGTGDASAGPTSRDKR